MKIELKNIYTNERFSEETNCFKADIFLNGKKVGYAENDGRGGSTNYNRYEGSYEVIQSMKDYCKTLPPIIYTKEEHGWDCTIDMTLEHYIDDCITEHLKKKAEKGLVKDFNKGLCYGTRHSYNIQQFMRGSKGITIEELLKDDKGITFLIDKCAKLIMDNKKIMNTNLPFYKNNLLDENYLGKMK